MREKERHDAWVAEHVANAVGFVACASLGQGRYDKRRARTLQGARRHKQQMLAEYAESNYGRGVLIYAVTRDNCTIHIE